MVGYSDFALALLEPGSEAHRAVEEMLKASQRATALTTQLLAFSRRQVVDRQVLDPNAVVAEMGALLRRVIGEQIELELALSRRAGWVRSDRSQLEQILTNLVVNARDSIPPAGGRIVVATGAIELGEDNVDRLAPGAYTMLVRPGQRLRHGRGDDRADLRAVLHDEAAGPGDGARARDGLRDRRAERRRHPDREQARRGLDVRRAPPGGARERRRGGSRERRGARRGAAGADPRRRGRGRRPRARRGPRSSGAGTR